ncbi:MAG TPA: ABC transporter permease [Cyclobacteriaceae bacterium]|jgi:putative ABC transport system permease protein|nr:ABC transporter permease [Cyclobacteriaceae bacterium]
MNLIENIKEGIRSVQANMLRSILTALIVAIGITSLVGILTAIEGIEYSVSESLSSLGVNVFDISSKQNRSSSQQGRKEKPSPPLYLSDAEKFIARYNYPASISLSANLTSTAEVKHGSKKTNPNVSVAGINQDYMAIKGLDIESGRNFSTIEIQFGTRVAIIGKKLSESIYEANEQIIGSVISFKGNQFKIIGVIKEEGSIAENNYDNMAFIPVMVANQLAEGAGLNYWLTIGITDITKMDAAMGEATGLMRSIRQDRVGKPNSFEIAKSETLAQELENITGILRLGGFGVGFITLLGACIALMNIMLVSVTERTMEVGVRKALGATPLRIRQQFIIEALIVCVIGGLAGVIFGILIGNLIASFMSVDAFIVPWVWMFVGMLVCLFVGLISGYYPASKASKLDPIESLRFE